MALGHFERFLILDNTCGLSNNAEVPIILRPSVTAIVCVLLIAVAAGTGLWYSMTGDTVVELGPRSMTGLLLRAELSFVRRGTHLLMNGDRALLFVESATVNLYDIEGEDILIQGNVEANTDTAQLPVLVAQSVTVLTGPVRRWTIASFGMTLEVPLAWEMRTLRAGAVDFHQSGHTLLSLSQETGAVLPTGDRVLIGGMTAVRTTGSDDVVRFFLPSSAGRIVFTPDESLLTDGADGSALRHLLQSVTITFAARSMSSSPSSGNGSSSVRPRPCGGAAGILCSSGQYCAIVDRELGIGVCTTIGGR